MTAAHDQMQTLHILSHIPEHDAREDDPHYHLFEQAKSRIKRQGLWKCVIADDLCGGPVALHHSHVEFSQINNVDERKVEQALGLCFGNDEDFQQWIEGPGNLEVLCLPGSEPVLMADGTERAIADVRAGDLVLGHDLRGHAVSSTTVSDFTGQLVAIDGHRMTGNHPVLTERGWLQAASVRPGDLACFVTPADSSGAGSSLGVLDAHVLAMGGVQSQVLRAIIVPDPVNVMDVLTPGQRPTYELLHNEPVLENISPVAPRTISDEDVPHRVSGSAATAGISRTRQGVKASDSTVVGAILPAPHTPSLGCETVTTAGAENQRVSSATLLTSRPTTFRATRRVPLGELGGDTIVITADGALLDGHCDVPPYERRWRPILHVETLPFEGKVYDIGVQGSASFVTSDLVVHNCANHHTSHYGIHVVPAALWEALRFHRAGAPAAAEFIAAKDMPQ